MPATGGGPRARAGSAPGRPPRDAGPRRGRAGRRVAGRPGASTASTAASASSRVSTRSWSASWPPIHDATWRVSSMRSSRPPGEVALGLLQLGRRDELVAQPGELDEDRLEGGRQTGRIDPGRHLQRPGVGVVDQPGRRRRRRDPSSSRTDRKSRLLMPSPRTALRTARVQLSGMVAMQGRHAEADLRLARVALAGRAGAARPGSTGAGANSGPRRCRSRRRVDETDRLVVGQVADDRDDRVGRPVGAPPEVADGVFGQRPGCLPRRRRSRGRAARRRTSPSGTGSGSTPTGSSRYERISSMITVRSLSMSRVLEARPDDQLADDVHRAVDLAARHAHPVDRRLAVGGRVERATDALDRLADRAGRRVGASCP